jgi:DnaK suppressor protein
MWLPVDVPGDVPAKVGTEPVVQQEKAGYCTARLIASQVQGQTMNLSHFRHKLLAKEHEFQSDLAAFESQGIAAGKAEVRDSIDDATISQSTSEAFEAGTIASQSLEAVQDALRRIESGTYGKCTLCGREIEPARLEAIPWTAFCLEDQEKREKTP